jgi:hypothetical protein
MLDVSAIPREPIAQGRTAEIFPWEDGKVVKLFHDGNPVSEALRESRLVRLVERAGLHVANVDGLVEVGGRIGLIYEYHKGRSLLHAMAARPWSVAWGAFLFADLQIGLHSCVVEGMPSQRRRLEGRIDGAAILSRKRRDALIGVLRGLPDGDRLCHGDFHPDNVLLDDDGPTIIDWADATRGNPWADVAQTSVLFDVSPVPHGTPRPWLVDMFRWLFHTIYRRRYAALRPSGRESLAVWRPLVAAARLADCPPAEREGLLAIVEKSNRG